MPSSDKIPAAVAAPDAPPQEHAKRIFELPVFPGVAFIPERRIINLLLLSAMIYILASCFANEWLYLLAASFLTACTLGFWLPLAQVVDVAVDASMPDELQVLQVAEIKIRLRKLFLLGPISSIIPTRWLRVHMDLTRRGVFGQKAEPVFPPEPLLVETIADELWLVFATPNLSRGVYRLEKIELMSCFPFGLTWWKRTFRKQVDIRGNPLSITVHPPCLPISGNFLFSLTAITSTMGLRSSSSIAVMQSTSVRSVREFKVGDSTRHIHWPSTARLGKLLVREFDDETLPVFDLLLDLQAEWKNRQQFELAVCMLHSLIRLGYNLGCVPELFINPPLNSRLVAEGLMFDLPQIPPGVQLLSEILARVEPLNMYPQSLKKNPHAEIEDWRSVPRLGDRPLLTILPAAPALQSDAPDQGNSAPIIFALASTTSTGDLAGTQNDKYESASGKEAKENADLGKMLGSEPPSSVIATIYGEGDLVGL